MNPRILKLKCHHLIFITYFIEKNKEYYIELFKNNKKYELDKNKNPYYNYDYWITFDYPIKIRLFKVTKTQINSTANIIDILYYIIILLIVFGFICYAGELKLLMKNPDVTWKHIFLNDIKCGFRHPDKPLLYYFKSGLNILK